NFGDDTAPGRGDSDNTAFLEMPAVFVSERYDVERADEPIVGPLLNGDDLGAYRLRPNTGLKNEPPTPFKSEVAHYWDDKPPIVARITAVDGRSLRTPPIIGPGQEQESFWSLSAPSKFCRSVRSLNLTPQTLDIINDDPITSCMATEEFYDAEGTTI